MRLSIRSEDPGYRDWCKLNGNCKRARVFLDGVEQKRCITADDATGELVRVVETDTGRVAFDRFTGTLLEETVRGEVRIEIDA